MSKEMNNIEVIENENVEEVMETETKEKFGAKAVSWVKRNGKKAAKIIVGTIVVGGIGYVLGQKSAGAECDCIDEECDFDIIEDDFVDSDPV